MSIIPTQWFVTARRRLVVPVTLVGTVLLAISAARAQSYSWQTYNGTSAAPTMWSDVSNWSAPPVYGTDATLSFSASMTQPGPSFTMTNDVSATANSMVFALDGYTFVPAIPATAAATLNLGNDPTNTQLALAASSTSVAPSIVQNGNGSVLMQANGAFGNLDIQGGQALRMTGTGLGAVRIDAPITSSGTTGLTVDYAASAVKSFSSGATTILGGPNSFVGNVTLNSGNLGLASSSAIGDPGNQLIINPGANSLRFVAPATATAPITIANPVVLNGTMLISSADGGGANFTGGISGPGGITVNNLLTISQGFFNLSGVQTPNINIQSAATFGGPLIVKPMAGGFGTGGSNLVAISSNATTGTDGSLTTTDIRLYPAGYLSLNDTAANHTRLAPGTTVTSYRGFVGLFANASVGATETIGILNASGWTSLYAVPTAGAGAQLTVTTLNRPQNGTLEFRGPNLGGTPGANVANFYVTNNPGGATPGSATPGTQNLAVLPYALSNAIASDGRDGRSEHQPRPLRRGQPADRAAEHQYRVCQRGKSGRRFDAGPELLPRRRRQRRRRCEQQHDRQRPGPDFRRQ